MTEGGAREVAAFCRRGGTSDPAAAAAIEPDQTDQRQASPSPTGPPPLPDSSKGLNSSGEAAAPAAAGRAAQPPSQPKHPDKVVQRLRELLQPLRIADAAMREAGSAAGVEDIDDGIMSVLETVSTTDCCIPCLYIAVHPHPPPLLPV